MLHGLGYLYKFVMFYLSFFKKQRTIDLKSQYAKILLYCIIFLFVLKIGSVGPVDQQINLASH